jgi:hypothetical protein
MRSRSYNRSITDPERSLNLSETCCGETAVRAHSSRRASAGAGTATMVCKFWIFSLVAYTLGYMRRAIAILMLLIFGSFLGAPLLATTNSIEQNNLPACCRRNGSHHCVTGMTEGDPGTTQVSAPPEKCPMFPHTGQMTPVKNSAIAPSSTGVFYACLQSHPACHAQSEAHRRISFDRSRQKRGPPAAFELS